jgi:3-deoxy-D-manno-octulosonic-acid transferase
MRSLYSLLLYAATPLVLLYLFLRGLRSPGYLHRWSERLGFFAAPRRTGGIAVHAVSMGEVNAAAELVKALADRYPDAPLYFTTFTPTGSERVRALFGERVFHVYAPLDLPGAVRRFFRQLQPRLLVIMETEIWPNLFYEAQTRGMPILIANARISPRSFQSYRRFRGLTAAALARVSHIAAQSRADAGRLIELGASEANTSVSGNLKFDLKLPPGLHEEGEALRSGWGAERPVLVAGSSHEGDERPLLEAFGRLLAQFPDALLVLVPRHPERFGKAAQLARDAGLNLALHSEDAGCPRSAQCFVVDAMGELLRYYAACDVAFVGGTLAPVGGHNVLEPAALSRPVLFGPHTANAADNARQLLECGAAVQVADEQELETVLLQLFADPERRSRMGRASLELVRSGQGAVGRTLYRIERLITPEAG